jgi:uncharacterized protein involved in outer membrane biogenesis
MKKKILIVSGIVVAVIVVVIAIVAANLDKIINSRKGELLAQAKATTGRDISIGDVGVSLWPPIGARVSDVVIGEDPEVGTEPFVTAKDVTINLKLIPLFKKQVEVKRFVLNEPSITVVKIDPKRFNFTSLIEKTSAAKPGEGGRGSAANKQAAFVLAVADIKGGTVHYMDRVTGLDRTIRDIDFAGRDVSLNSEMKAKIAAAVFSDQQDIQIDAKVGPIGTDTSPENLARAPLSVSFEMEPTTFAALQAFTPPKPGAKPSGPPQEGKLGVKAALKGTVGAANLESCDIDIAALGAEEPNIKITASGGPFNLTADSTQVYANARVKGSLNAESIPLSGVKLTQKDPSKPKPVIGGDAKAHAEFDGAMSALAFNGEVDATNMTYEVPAQIKKDAGIPAKATFRGTFRPQGTPNQGVELSAIDVTFHALHAKGSGTIVPFKGHEAMNLSFEGSTPLGPWKDLLPAMAEMSPSGDAKVSVRVSGAPKPGVKPDIRGTATLTNFGAKMAALPKPISNGAATVEFTDKTAHIPNATFSIGSSRFQVSADVSSFTPMRSAYTVTSPEIARLDVQAAAPNAKPLPRPEVFRDVVVKGEAVQKAPKVVENSLTITSKSGIATNIDYTDAEAVVRATPEKSVIERFSAKAMGGTVSGSGTFEPKISKFDLKTKVENVNLVEYFRFKSPALADVLVGRISADFDIAGQGKTWEALQKTLTGGGSTLVVEGAFLKANLAQQLFTSVQATPLVPAGFVERIKAKNPKLFSENKTAFENLAGKVRIADGKINAGDLKLVSNDFTMGGDGWFSFTKEMDLNTTFTLSQKLTNDLIAEVPVAKYLVNSNGRFELPIKLSGAVMKPNVGVDSNAISARLQQGLVQQGKQEAKDEVNKQVKGLLDGLTKKKPPATPPKTEPAKPDTTKKAAPPPAPPDTTKQH